MLLAVTKIITLEERQIEINSYMQTSIEVKKVHKVLILRGVSESVRKGLSLAPASLRHLEKKTRTRQKTGGKIFLHLLSSLCRHSLGRGSAGIDI